MRFRKHESTLGKAYRVMRRLPTGNGSPPIFTLTTVRFTFVWLADPTCNVEPSQMHDSRIRRSRP